MLNSIKVRDHMVKHPATVHPDTDLFQAIHVLLANKISGVTVVNERKEVVGMLSEMDCLKAILNGSYHGEVGGIVSQFMISNVETIGPEDNVLEIAQDMFSNKRRRLPVVEDGIMVGQLSCRNVLKAVKDFSGPADPTED